MAMAGENETHSTLMDAVYRNQRHIYDLTRKYYLLGRDAALRQIEPRASQSLLEIGCGTGRNLALAAKIYPDARLFGLDISEEMLKTARAKLAKKGLGSTVALGQADATAFDPKALFDEDGFDRILISYAISMIPVWQDAIMHAAQTLAPGGELHIVDFGQQAGLPKWFRSALHSWLAKFHVEPRAELEAALRGAASTIGGSYELQSLYRDYAWHGIVRRS